MKKEGKQEGNMSGLTSEAILATLNKVVEGKKKEKYIERELDSCVRQIKDTLGVDVVIKTKKQLSKENEKGKNLSYSDIKSISRTLFLPDRIQTTVVFNDGTSTSVVLNNNEDADDKEKAVMWCLLKKCFTSKRGLERVIYALEENV